MVFFIGLGAATLIRKSLLITSKDIPVSVQTTVSRGIRMGLLSNHEAIVWGEFQKGKSTSEIAYGHRAMGWTPSYASRVLNRAREKMAGALRGHAERQRRAGESRQR